MAMLISDAELRTVLCNPAELYAAVTSWSHYKPKEPAISGDCELLLTDMVAMGRIALCTLVHSRREAFLSLLTADDALSFRDRLGDAVFEMNSTMFAETVSRPGRIRF